MQTCGLVAAAVPWCPVVTHAQHRFHPLQPDSRRLAAAGLNVSTSTDMTIASPPGDWPDNRTTRPNSLEVITEKTTAPLWSPPRPLWPQIVTTSVAAAINAGRANPKPWSFRDHISDQSDHIRDQINRSHDHEMSILIAAAINRSLEPRGDHSRDFEQREVGGELVMVPRHVTTFFCRG